RDDVEVDPVQKDPAREMAQFRPVALHQRLEDGPERIHRVELVAPVAVAVRVSRPVEGGLHGERGISADPVALPYDRFGLALEIRNLLVLVEARSRGDTGADQ